MDPDASPSLCERLGGGLCLQTSSPEELGQFRDRILEGPAPADTLLPSVLLGLAVLLACIGSVIRPRLGISETMHHLGISALVIAAVVIGGVRPSTRAPAAPMGDEIAMGIDVIFAYGIPAIVAVLVGLVVGMFIEDRWSVPAKPPLSRGTDEPSDHSNRRLPG